MFLFFYSSNILENIKPFFPLKISERVVWLSLLLNFYYFYCCKNLKTIPLIIESALKTINENTNEKEFLEKVKAVDLFRNKYEFNNLKLIVAFTIFLLYKGKFFYSFMSETESKIFFLIFMWSYIIFSLYNNKINKEIKENQQKVIKNYFSPLKESLNYLMSNEDELFPLLSLTDFKGSHSIKNGKGIEGIFDDISKTLKLSYEIKGLDKDLYLLQEKEKEIKIQMKSVNLYSIKEKLLEELERNEMDYYFLYKERDFKIRELTKKKLILCNISKIFSQIASSIDDVEKVFIGLFNSNSYKGILPFDFSYFFKIPYIMTLSLKENKREIEGKKKDFSNNLEICNYIDAYIDQFKIDRPNEDPNKLAIENISFNCLPQSNLSDNNENIDEIYNILNNILANQLNIILNNQYILNNLSMLFY